MAERIPSVEDSLADPTKPRTSNTLVKNLHIVLPGIAIGAFLIITFIRAATDDGGTKLKTPEELAAEVTKGESSLTQAAPAQMLQEEIERQRREGAKRAQEQEAANQAIASLGQRNPPGLPDVPTAAGRPAGGLSEAERAAAIEKQKREELIRASEIVALRGAGDIKTGAYGAQAGSPGNVLAALNQQIAEAQKAPQGATAQPDQFAKLLAAASAGQASTAPQGGGSPATSGFAAPGQPGQGARRSDNGAWLDKYAQQSGAARQTITLDQMGPTPVIHQGTSIPLALVGAINSDLPGQITATVTMDVYDSIRGDYLLIPKGSRVVGRYNNDVQPGQERVMSAFERLIRPDGSSITLAGMPASDAIGQSGVQAEVDNHFWKMFSSSLLIGGVAWLFEKEQPSTVVVSGQQSSSFGQEAGKIFGDVARAILERNRSIPPTLHIEHGHKFNVTVTRDISVPPYGAPSAVGMFR